MLRGNLIGNLNCLSYVIAGPSEILIICDGKTDPDWIAMDLFSQAEHDEDAQSILLCPDADFIAQVESPIASQVFLPIKIAPACLISSSMDSGSSTQNSKCSGAI
jgi:histidinol dehydrogenase